MIQRDYLIIGSGIGGGSVCEAIRQHDKKGSVTLVGGETFHPYKRWMLSKQFLRDKTPSLKKLPCYDERWYATHKIESRLGTVVTQFNIDRRLAVLGNGETVEFKKACLAMGSRPVRPH
ncbi:MAG: FAD-dependent oxidoreductase, partial [Bryobacteraceae bacterium]